MPIGPGKYDNICTDARKQADADSVVLIVHNGILGSGFSVQTADPAFASNLPRLLRVMADEIERDGAH
jgi:hypothetical protein